MYIPQIHKWALYSGNYRTSVLRHMHSQPCTYNYSVCSAYLDPELPHRSNGDTRDGAEMVGGYNGAHFSASHARHALGED